VTRRSSTSILDEIADTALEPGYALRAAERGGSRATGRRALHVGLALVLVVAGFVLALTLADVRRSAPEASQARGQLAERVKDRTAETDALSAQVSTLRQDVARARDEELATSREGRQRAETLAGLELVTGAVPVTGPGLRVTVDDAPSTPEDDDGADLGQVQDRDLQLVVNGVWAAGAEAVAVNGYRVTARTAIRSAGEAILVDFRPIAPPYVVEGIGDPARLQARFLDGPGGRALTTLNATYGIRFSTESVARMTLPAAVSLGDLEGTTTGGTS
jgi:uncharacterized protein YlxW (UPF0749 family)